MSFDDRRTLISSFFAGKDSQGRRLGVYIYKDRDVSYEVRGMLGQTFKGIVGEEEEVYPSGNYLEYHGRSLNKWKFSDLSTGTGDTILSPIFI
jgi:hypothetical protein